MFKNEKVEKVNEQLEKLEAKKSEIVKAIGEMEAALENTVEMFALGQITEKDLEEATQFLKERRAELADVERMIAKVASVRRKVAIESVPFVKKYRNEKVEKVQAEYNEQIEKVHEARAAFLSELAALGQIKNKVGGINSEYNEVMRELGVSPSQYGVTIQEKAVISGGWTNKVDCLGVDEPTQKQAYSTGRIPNGYGVNDKSFTSS